MQEKYYLLKQKRIELFGEKLKAIKDELDKRELKEVPTEKLFDLLLKYSAALRGEAVELRFVEKVENFDPFERLLVKSWKP